MLTNSIFPLPVMVSKDFLDRVVKCHDCVVEG